MLLTIWRVDTFNQRFLLLVLGCVWGACWGSFLQASAHRIPRGMSLLYPGSHCPQCLTPLLSSDNLPIVGWLRLRGKCRHCQMPIPFRYLWVEIICALMGMLLITLALELSETPLATFLMHFSLFSLLLLIALIDRAHRTIPDVFTLGPLLILMVTQHDSAEALSATDPLSTSILAVVMVLPILLLDLLRSTSWCLLGADRTDTLMKKLSPLVRKGDLPKLSTHLFVSLVAAVAFFFFPPDFQNEALRSSWIGMAAGTLLLGTTDLVCRPFHQWKPTLGLGDLKLVALMGWWLGPEALVFALGVACTTGLIMALVFRKRGPIPFGPFLALGTFCAHLTLALAFT